MISPVDLTRKLVRIDSVNPPGREKVCVDLIEPILINAGFETSQYEFAEERTSLVARCGNGDGRPICFTGHLDTVPLGKRAWLVDPFGGEIIGDKLYGRGASDMKSGVAAMICAAVNLAEELHDGPGVTFVLTAGEETGCQGAQHLAGITDALGEVGALVVGEMTANYPVIGHKGALWLEIQTEGVTTHGSTPGEGVNAVYSGAQLVTKLENYDLDVAPHEMLGSPTLSVGTFKGGMSINTVPDYSHIGVDIRTVPGVEHDSIRRNLHQYLGDEAAVISTVADLKSVYSEPDDAWMQQVYSIVGQHLDSEITPRTAHYYTDASILKQAYCDIPTIVLGPGEPDQAHRTDEYCRVSQIEMAVEIYQDLMQAWCEFETCSSARVAAAQ